MMAFLRSAFLYPGVGGAGGRCCVDLRRKRGMRLEDLEDESESPSEVPELEVDEEQLGALL